MLTKNQIKTLGDVLTIANPILGLVIIFFTKDYFLSISYFIVYVLGTLACQAIKGLCDAQRPRDGGQYEIIKICPYSHEDGESCCSGHAMSAALPAYYTLIWISFWWFLPLFILSTICAWTRVKVKAHWVFDVILSNLIALCFSIIVKYIYIVIL